MQCIVGEMATRSALGQYARLSQSPAPAMYGTALRGARFLSDGKGKVLSEEERAAENVYIQKMEREKMEKLKQQQEKVQKDKGDKKHEESDKS